VILLPFVFLLTASVFIPQVDTPDLDDAASFIGFSIISQLANVVKIAMNPTCVSNVVSLLCHTAFKECAAVEDTTTGTQLWLP
jgi:hypothetical protein